MTVKNHINHEDRTRSKTVERLKQAYEFSIPRKKLIIHTLKTNNSLNQK